MCGGWIHTGDTLFVRLIKSTDQVNLVYELKKKGTGGCLCQMFLT